MDFIYQPTFVCGKDVTEYELLTKDYVRCLEVEGRQILQVDPKALSELARKAFCDVSFYLRANHLKQLASILEDPEASGNDRFVALTLLKNSVIAAKRELPTCQDTGTAIVMGWKGENVWTGGDDEEALSRGIFETFQEQNLRYSQLAPQSMFEEKNTGTNLPAQIEIKASAGNEYHFLMLAKGGGSANKSFLYQESKALLNEKSMAAFFEEKIRTIGTAACPPYHFAIVIGGTSAEANLKAVKLASTGYYDDLPVKGDGYGQAFRDREWEKKIEIIAQQSGIGAQFGGKYLAHDVRVIRLPRHAASCPVGIGLSCSADRNIRAKITAEGLFIEKLEKNPEKYVPSSSALKEQQLVSVDLDQPMEEILKTLSQHPVKTRLALNGTLIVARDTAHAKIKQMLDEGKPMPEYFKNHPVYYAGPAKTPQGKVTGSFGPTTAARMDGYVSEFMSRGASRIMVAKGNRSPQVAQACKKYGGFYLGSIGGPAAILAEENILSVELQDFEELGMEAVRKIRVKDFPAFIVCDDKGNDFLNLK
ncbi:FumA C-terminus/TtdB family hydratase beta subunit [Omnitrophica bacterium]|nr:FumA C-terminus/TtdB family hydratase beta subunit [Candidatus Omnitrophota bacterium]